MSQLPDSTPGASSVQLPIEPRLDAAAVLFSRKPGISLLFVYAFEFWYSLLTLNPNLLMGSSLN